MTKDQFALAVNAFALGEIVIVAATIKLDQLSAVLCVVIAALCGFAVRAVIAK